MNYEIVYIALTAISGASVGFLLINILTFQNEYTQRFEYMNDFLGSFENDKIKDVHISNLHEFRANMDSGHNPNIINRFKINRDYAKHVEAFQNKERVSKKWIKNILKAYAAGMMIVTLIYIIDNFI